jgi:hypothetical protein
VAETGSTIPDDGPTWPKHVTRVKTDVLKDALKTVILSVKVCIISVLLRDLRHVKSLPPQTLGSWVRIPLEAFCCVCVLCR